MLTHTLVALNVLVFIAMAVSGASVMEPSGPQLVAWGANYGPLTLSGQWWRLLSYNFVHIGILHIGFNMWCLWDLGALAESLYGTWTFGVIYMISGVAGGLLSVGWNPGRLSAGASGAIFGLAGALIAGFYFGEFSIPRPMIQMQLRSLLVFVGYNVIFGVMSGVTDNSAHLGGILAGALCGALIARVAPSARDVSSRAAILLLIALGLAGTTYGLERSRGYLIHLRQGETLLQQQRNQEAVGELQTAVHMRPNDAQARISLADAYYRTKEFPKAEAEIKQVMALEPNDANAANFLGFIYLEEKRAVDAERIFSELVAKNSRSAQAHYGLGMALADEDKHEAALQEYNSAIRLSPRLEGVYYQVGRSDAKLRRFDDAIAAYQKELQQSGDDADVEIALADAYEAKGMKAQAEEARQAAEKMKEK